MIQALSGDPTLVAVKWYQWGAAIGLAITLVVTFWVFFDSQRQGFSATLWRAVSLAAALVVVPSAVLSLAPALAVGLGSLPVLLAYLGIAATLLSLLVLVLYAAGIGVTEFEESDIGEVEEPSLVHSTGAQSSSVTPPVMPAAGPQDTSPAPGGEVVASQSVDLSTSLDDRTRVMTVAPQPLEPLAWLVVMNGHRAGREFRLAAITDIGRDDRYNTIAIEDPTMSRQHCRVRFEKDDFVIYDLASANGVIINGEKQQRWTLTNGERLLIGQTEFGFLRVAGDTEA